MLGCESVDCLNLIIFSPFQQTIFGREPCTPLSRISEDFLSFENFASTRLAIAWSAGYIFVDSASSKRLWPGWDYLSIFLLVRWCNQACCHDRDRPSRSSLRKPYVLVWRSLWGPRFAGMQMMTTHFISTSKSRCSWSEICTLVYQKRVRWVQAFFDLFFVFLGSCSSGTSTYMHDVCHCRCSESGSPWQKSQPKVDRLEIKQWSHSVQDSKFESSLSGHGTVLLSFTNLKSSSSPSGLVAKEVVVLHCSLEAGWEVIIAVLGSGNIKEI